MSILAVLPGSAVQYIRSTGQIVPATVLGPSAWGAGYLRLQYECDGGNVVHEAAPLAAILMSPTNSTGEVVDPFQPGTSAFYKRSTGQVVPATILGPSSYGNTFVRIQYVCAGQVAVYDAAPRQCVALTAEALQAAPGGNGSMCGTESDDDCSINCGEVTDLKGPTLLAIFHAFLAHMCAFFAPKGKSADGKGSSGIPVLCLSANPRRNARLGRWQRVAAAPGEVAAGFGTVLSLFPHLRSWLA